MNLTRWTSTIGAGAVAGIAAWSSWSHMVYVAMRVGERPEVAYALPLSVDGLLVVAAAAMTDDKLNGRTPRTSAKVAFAAGVVATVAANVASAQGTWGARMVAAWPAIALLLVVELLSRRGRDRRPEAAMDTATEPATVTDSRPAIPVATKPDSKPATRPDAPRPPRQPAARPAAASGTAAKVAKVAAKLPDVPADKLAAKVAAKVGISERSARRYLAAFRTDSPAATDPAMDRVNGSAVTA